jgi:hypothetical protein
VEVGMGDIAVGVDLAGIYALDGCSFVVYF